MPGAADAAADAAAGAAAAGGGGGGGGGGDAALVSASARRRTCQRVTAAVGAALAVGFAAAGGAAAFAAALPAAAFVYAVSRLASTDYDNPAETRALRRRLERHPAGVLRWHRPADVFRRAGEEVAVVLSRAARSVGGLELLAACRGARGGGLPAVLAVGAPGAAALALARAAASALSQGPRVRAQLKLLCRVADGAGWEQVCEAGGRALRLRGLLDEAAIASVGAASLRELAEVAGKSPINGGSAQAAARSRARGLVFLGAAGGLHGASRAAGHGGIQRLVHARLLLAEDLAEALWNDAHHGRSLTGLVDELGSQAFSVLPTGEAAGAKEALRAMLLVDMRRAASYSSMHSRGDVAAHEALISSRALSLAENRRGFGEGALTATLVEHRRRWREARDVKDAAVAASKEAHMATQSPDSSSRGDASSGREAEQEFEAKKRELVAEWARVFAAAAPAHLVDDRASVGRTAGAASAVTAAAAPISSSTPSTTEASEVSVCKVCLDAPLEVLLRPCRHLCVCQQCSGRLSECPICRGQIESRERIFAA